MAGKEGWPRRRFSGVRDWLAVLTPGVLIVALGFAVAFGFVEPAPPDHIVIAAGGDDGAYTAFARRYAKLLARDKVTLDVRTTKGSVENLRLLQSGAVDVAIVQGGLERPPPIPGRRLRALASVFLEPLWIFSHDPALNDPSGLRGKRVAIGPEGSGTAAIAREVLRANGLGDDAVDLRPIGGTAAAAALRAGEIDAAFFVLSPDSPIIAGLMAEDGIYAASFARADAYARRYRYLSEVTLPRGAIDLAADRPRRNTVLVAPVAALVATEAFHPALIGLLLEAAKSVHGGGSLVSPAGEFPSARHLDDPIDDEAKRYLAEGPSFLHRYLPFWIANFLDRTKVLLLPLVALLLPVFRIILPTYRWRIRSRVYRWYDVLEGIESEARDADPEARTALLEHLAQLEQQVERIHIPPAYADALYALRLHISHVRRVIEGSR